MPWALSRWQWRALVAREADYLRSMHADLRWPQVSTASFGLEFRRFPKGDFFIFGNGDSLNELTDTEFQFIEKSFSVGLNAFALHPFVPSAYAFELYKWDYRNRSELEFLLRLASQRQLGSQVPLWLLRPKTSQLEQLSYLLSAVDGLKLELYGRANLPRQSSPGLESQVAAALRFLGQRREYGSVALDNGASVVRMVSLALVHGFTRVILVGVDLTDTPYFWSNPRFIEEHGDFTEICRRRPGEGTSTLLTNNRPHSAEEFLHALARVAHEEFQAEIFVASQKSRLAQQLRRFPF